jgi:membrane-anchored protein YejM (alkaline phosphatase superfamily)
MGLSWRSDISINRFELISIILLLIALNINASSSMMGLLIASAQTIFLAILFIGARAAVGLFSETAAKFFFAVTLVFMMAEAMLHLLTGLHMNWFVVTLILEDLTGLHTGIPFFQVGLLLAAMIVVALFLRARLNQSFSLPSPLILLASSIFAFSVAQVSYATLYFYGASDAMLVRRGLPLFWTPHSYYNQKLLGFILGPRQTNPFALSEVKTQSSALSNDTPLSENNMPIAPKATPPNILFLIADSIRSVGLETPISTLMPNINAAATQGMLDLSHNSVSNCTHFSLFSLFTGQLSTEFGGARRRHKSVGLMPALVKIGYSVTTAETESLDWYDLSEILVPSEAQRWVSTSDDALVGDTEVSEKTIETLKAWKNDSVPNAHFAFYQGSHFPYGESIGSTQNTLFEQYKETIGFFDTEIGKVIQAVDDLGLANNTLIIVTSDHGEEFLSDGRMGHATRLSQRQTIVPFLVLGADKTAQNIRSHLDVTPFIYSQILQNTPPLTRPNTVYMANCDYDYPNGFIVQKAGHSFEFAYDDGYLVAMDKPEGKKNLQDETALMLLRTITNKGMPSQSTN